MGIEIRLAQTENEKMNAYGLRYDIYIHELRRNFVIETPNQLSDSFDKNAYIFVGYDNGNLVATARVNLAINSKLPFEEQNQVRTKFQEYYPYVSSTTKLAVHKNYRSSTLAFRMVSYIYKFGLEKNIHYDFINVAYPHLIEFYLRLGYKKYINPFINNNIEFMPMVLDALNLKYLKEIKSPFAKILNEHQKLSVTNFNHKIQVTGDSQDL